MKNTLFSSNRDVGKFMTTIVSDAGDMLCTISETKEKKTVVDLGVYSKNRLFRTLWSVKAGSNDCCRRLDPTPDTALNQEKIEWRRRYYGCFDNNDVKHLFFSSLVTPPKEVIALRYQSFATIDDISKRPAGRNTLIDIVIIN